MLKSFLGSLRKKLLSVPEGPEQGLERSWHTATPQFTHGPRRAEQHGGPQECDKPCTMARRPWRLTWSLSMVCKKQSRMVWEGKLWESHTVTVTDIRKIKDHSCETQGVLVKNQANGQ